MIPTCGLILVLMRFGSLGLRLVVWVVLAVAAVFWGASNSSHYFPALERSV